MSDIGNWLEVHGLGKYAEAFATNEIDLRALPRLTEEDLKELGLPIGARRNVQAAIEQLSASEPGPNSPPAEEEFLPARSSGAERRQLTVMFADLADSTELSRQLDPEDLREVNLAYQDAAKAAIERYGGYVARYMGDGVLAYFGYPHAHEDDAERALRAGLLLTEAIPSLGTAVTLAVRVGIATGPVVVGDIIGDGRAQESAVVGETPNLAARLQGVAEPNSVVISAATEALTAGLFELEALAARTLKGFSDEITCYLVQAEMRGESRFAARSGTHLSPFVGREEEIELLTRRWFRVRKGRAQVGLIVGEAGIGKSRLLQQLREHIGTDPHETIALQCSPYHGSSPLYPVITEFERALVFGEVADTSGRLMSLQHHLEEVGQRDERELGLLAHLLSISVDGRFADVETMNSAQRRDGTLRSVVDYIIKRARRSPLLCIFEDIHWADPTTIELLGRLVESIESDPVLLVATTRPGFAAAWTDLPHAQVLNISRLGSEEGEQLARAVNSRSRAAPTDVVQAVLSRAGGNPLFIEELTRTVVHSTEMLTPDHVIPATLQDLLMARIDALQSGKSVAQCAAVIGRAFEHRLLSAVWEGPPSGLSEGLEELEKSGLVTRHGEGGLAQYIFKHALIRDTAYASLLRGVRSRLHERVATALEALAPETLSNEPELLARHYTESGSVSRAIELWLAAAERANSRSACQESLTHVAAALGLIDGLAAGRERDLKEVDLVLSRALAERTLRGESALETGEAYIRAREVSERLGDPGRLFTALEGCSAFHTYLGEISEGRANAEQMLTIAGEMDDPLMLARGYATLGMAFRQTSDLTLARKNLERGLSACEEAGVEALSAMDFSVDVRILRLLAWVYSNLGYFDQALWAGEEAFRRAEHYGNLFQVGDALGGLTQTLLLRHDYQRLRDESQRMHTIASTGGLHYYLALADAYLGMALGGIGQLHEGIEQIKRATDQFESLGNPMGLGWVRMSPVSVYLAQAGRFEEAIDFATEAVSASERTIFEVFTLIHLGEVLRMTGDPESATSSESHLRTAVTLAREHCAKTAELEATMSLAKLWRDRGEPERAYESLASVHSWFTEGHGSGLLREAQSLLSELALPRPAFSFT